MIFVNAALNVLTQQKNNVRKYYIYKRYYIVPLKGKNLHPIN